uniref:Uncharacterized protein n=1 Tax=Anguilla anguilla TaxID=7936 RepID=A0A0E9W0N6_ANGAN
MIPKQSTSTSKPTAFF